MEVTTSSGFCISRCGGGLETGYLGCHCSEEVMNKARLRISLLGKHQSHRRRERCVAVLLSSGFLVGALLIFCWSSLLCHWKQYILLEPSRLIVSGTDFYFLSCDVLS